jgi:hypothetical protein
VKRPYSAKTQGSGAQKRDKSGAKGITATTPT